MRSPVLLSATVLLPLVAACHADRMTHLRRSLDEVIDQTGNAFVEVYFYDLDTGDSLAINADQAIHAASMMKVPVMIQVFRDIDAGRLSGDALLPVDATFESIVDGSPYSLSPSDDSDSTLYDRIGGTVAVADLVDLMITVSSNLAANLLLEAVGVERVRSLLGSLGVDPQLVLRGVEDIKAYEAGMSNRGTARDLGLLFRGIARAEMATAESCRAMLEILERQQFNDGIPAGLPRGSRVAHKTGMITRINHDGGVVFLPNGRSYVLVVLTSGIDDPAESDELIAELSRVVYDAVDLGLGP